MLEKLRKKHKKIVVGLMSGTSVDGIDTALVEIQNSGLKTKIKMIGFDCHLYPLKLKNYILKNSNPTTAKSDEIAELNFLLGEYFADAVIKTCKKNNVLINEVDLIGSHGQTIFHSIEKRKLFNKNIFATLQIGDPSVIAKRTGVITVGDFRTADISVGGSGAPLVPYFDYVLFRTRSKNRALLNIGGIANITVIPKQAKEADVFAFDTGPGNMMVDYLMHKLFNKKYDKDGKVAQNGNVNWKILDFMLGHKYFTKKPPKSCGRETFGEELIKSILARFDINIDRYDLIATFTEFTALSIWRSYEKFIREKIQIDELIVSGGGVHNKYLMSSLKKYFSGVVVKPIDEFNISSDAKEAICFAFLANEAISGNSANMLNATGAKQKTILGKICLP